MTDQSLSRRALRGALEVRKRAHVDLFSPLSVYDVAERLKVEVRFHPGSSFGGMYAKETQTVLVPSERPPGRRAFTCAHELGHWYFKHGTKVEELSEMEEGTTSDPEEILVNQFAGHLLMSKWAVEKALKDRGMVVGTAPDRDIYAVACQFGVGYETIVTHLRYALGFLTSERAEFLLRSSPKRIRQELLNESFPEHLVMVDRHWVQHIPIDLEVGHAALLLFDSKSEDSALTCSRVNAGCLFVARKPGISKVEATEQKWAAFVRVSRRGFSGRSIYRHLEDPDE